MLRCLVLVMLISGCATVPPKIVTQNNFLVEFYKNDSLRTEVVVLGSNQLVYCINEENVLIEKIQAKLGQVVIKSVRIQ